ncbi:MAG: TetR/AcrR family transcriptional regulator [Myxococcales bacterium]|nr:TetR/AcrR family transcriptional regulator [Myxococcales bacterium]
MNVHSQPSSAPSDTRSAILKAALGLFVERGFHGTTVPQIASRAGVAAGTMYRHFQSKEELVNVLYREAKGRFMQSFASDLSGADGLSAGASPRQQFRWFWFRVVDYARTHGDELAFLELHHHAAYLDQESLALEASSLEAFASFFEQPSIRKEMKPLPGKVLMVIVWGILAQLFKTYRLGHLPWSDALIAEAEAAAWDSVVAVPAS